MINKDFYLASNIKYLRNKKNKTQQDIANYCGKTNTAISNWEKGIREPDATDLAKLSNYFSISLDDLILKDLKISDYDDSKKDNELELLFYKHKDELSEKDKEYIKFILNQVKNEFENKQGEVNQ